MTPVILFHDRISPANQPVVELLGRLRQLAPDYPADLLAARRAAFVAQVATKVAAGCNPPRPELDGQRSLEGAHLRGRR